MLSETSFNHGHQSRFSSRPIQLVNRFSRKRDRSAASMRRLDRGVHNLCCLFLSHIAPEFLESKHGGIIDISQPERYLELVYRAMFSRCIMQFDGCVNAFWRRINDVEDIWGIRQNDFVFNDLVLDGFSGDQSNIYRLRHMMINNF